MNLRTLDLQKNNMSDVNAISVQALKPLKKLKVSPIHQSRFCH